MEIGNYDKAEEIVKRVYMQNPTDPQIIGFSINCIMSQNNMIRL